MTAKEFLQQYQNANKDIDAKVDQIYKLRGLATKTTQTLAPDRVSSSGEKDKVSSIVAKIVDMEREVDSDIDRLIDTKKQVEDAIEKVSNPKQRAVLTRRYINEQTWEQIAVSLDMSYFWVCTLHGRALPEIQNILQELIEVDT